MFAIDCQSLFSQIELVKNISIFAGMINVTFETESIYFLAQTIWQLSLQSKKTKISAESSGAIKLQIKD